jgi:polyferredoxin
MAAGALPGLSWGTTIRLGALAGVTALAILSDRSFCKALCPIGAFLAPLNLLCFWTVKAPRESCLSCQKCDKACGLDLKPSDRITSGVPASRDLDCILCYDCQTACKEMNVKTSGQDRAKQPSSLA